MRKKYLSALLFGALLFASAGTFTSCKDYDDDIKNLQEQVDKLATKEDMEAKLSQMQTALDAATATANEALEKANAAGNEEEIADLKERLDALEKATIDVEALKKELQDAVDGQLDGFRTEMEDLIKQVEELVGKLADMVTSVELVSSYTANPSKDAYPVLNFGTVTEKDNVFGEGLEGAITFKKGTQVQVGDGFIVRVSPANAVIDPSMVSLLNSKGEVLEGVKVTKVEPYNELLTRASGNNGLWKVSCELTQYDENAFKAFAESEGKDVLFAVAINNTLSTEGAETRQVVSSYDLTMKWAATTMANSLSYTVNDIDVDNIRNRYDAAEDGTKAGVTEYEWSGDAATAIDKNKTNVQTGDDRCANNVGVKFVNTSMTPKLLPVEQGKPFTIKVNDENNSIRAIYVTRDDANAVESAPSELNAWKGYTYEGLDTVVEGTETTVTINAENAINDIIGFRVYAVNYDGTLVDPDGKAFYVVVGKEASVSTANLTVSPKEYAWTIANAPTSDAAAKYFNSDEQAFSTANLKDVATFEVKQFAADGKTSAPFDGELYLTGTDMTPVRLQDALFGGVSDLSKYTKIQYRNVDVRDLKDGETYIVSVTFKDKNGGIIETATINVTKTMPTFPTAVSPFTNVLVNNVLVVYPKVKADDNEKVIYDLDNVWHGIDQYTTFAQTDVEAGKETVIYVPTTLKPETDVDDNVPALVAPKAILNPDTEANEAYKTEYSMTNEYTYGFISYAKLEGATEYTNNEWVVDGQSFKVRFGNYVDDCTYAWKEAAPVLAYPGVKDQYSYIELDKIAITDWYNRAASLATDADGYILNGYGESVQIDLLTGDDFSKVNEYYTAEVKKDYVVGKDDKGKDIKKNVILLTSTVTASQGADVPTKIRLTITDIYGFKTVKTFDSFTMTFKK